SIVGAKKSSASSTRRGSPISRSIPSWDARGNRDERRLANARIGAPASLAHQRPSDLIDAGSATTWSSFFSRRPSRLDSDPPPPDDDLVQTAFAPTAAGAFPDPQPRRQPRDDVPQPDCPIGKRIDRCNGKRQALLELATLAVRQHVDIRMAPDLVLRRSIFQSDVCRLSSIEDERVALERIFQVRRGRPALEGRHRDPRSGTRPL